MTHIKLDPVEYAAHVLAPLVRDPGNYVGRHRISEENNNQEKETE
jgi:hypothetical protein